MEEKSSCMRWLLLLLVWLQLSSLAVAQLTPEQRDESSDEIRDAIRREYGEPVVPDPNSPISQMFYKIAAQTERRDITYRIYVVKNDTMNAFSLPDGQVVFLTGLLDRLPSGDENALAFVAAHELAHLERNHIGRLARNAGVTSLLLGLLVQNSQEWVHLLANITNSVLVSGYSRGMEKEADLRGMELMQAAGYDPRGALTTLGVFKEMQAESGGVNLFPTHPNPSVRYQDAQAYLKKKGLDEPPVTAMPSPDPEPPVAVAPPPAAPAVDLEETEFLAQDVLAIAHHARPNGKTNPGPARAALGALVLAIGDFRLAVERNDGAARGYFGEVRRRDEEWRQRRGTLVFTPQERQAVQRLDTLLNALGEQY